MNDSCRLGIPWAAAPFQHENGQSGVRLEKHKFLNYLEANGSNMACPYCSCESWEMLIEDPVNLQDQRIMEFSLRRLTGGISVAAVVMVCGGCGFLRMHSVEKAIRAGYLS